MVREMLIIATRSMRAACIILATVYPCW